jgi:hypothetical protein
LTGTHRSQATILKLNLSLKDPLLQSAALGLQHLAQRLGWTAVGIEKVVLGGHSPLLSLIVGRVGGNEELDIAPLTPHREKFQFEAHNKVLLRPDLPQENDGDVLASKPA